MSKIALITDIHFCVRNSSLYFMKRQRLFFENIFFPYLEKHGIKTILCLGDTFEDRKQINILGLHNSREMFFDVAKAKNIKIISILGNHCVYFKNTNEITSMSIIENEYDNVHLIDGYEEFTFGNKTFGMMSWINNENLQDNLKIINETSKANYLCMHAEIAGFEMTKGHPCEKGFDRSIFNRFDLVLSGHFHHKNKIGNIYYIGNPFQTNWDDFACDRGFHVYDTDLDSFEFIKNTYENYNVLEYSDSINVDSFEFGIYEDQIVKVLIHTIADLNQINYNKFLDLLKETVYEYSVIETGYSYIDSAEIVSLRSNTEVINEYIESLSLEDNNLKADVLNIMHELHKEALSKRVSE